MTAILLSLASAVLYGVGDYWGGMASRKSHVFAVLPTIVLSGTVTVIALIPILGAQFSTRAVVAGTLAGVLGTIGFIAFYAALAIGPMGVGSAIAAVLAASIPYGVAVLRGTEVTGLGLIGASLAVVSIVLVCYTTPDAAHPVTRRLVITSTIAGFAIAGFFLLLAYAPKDAGIAPFVCTRLTNMTLILLVVFIRRNTFTRGVGNYPLAIVTGIFDALAAAAFIFAMHTGDLTVVAVISNLYPAVTLTIAHFAIHERVQRHQLLGLAGACASVALLSLAA